MPQPELSCSGFFPAVKASPPLPSRILPQGAAVSVMSSGRSLRDQIFFSLRTALKDRPKGPPTANRQPPPTANRDQPPTVNRCGECDVLWQASPVSRPADLLLWSGGSAPTSCIMPRTVHHCPCVSDAVARCGTSAATQPQPQITD